jgi:hypothetical protein
LVADCPPLLTNESDLREAGVHRVRYLCPSFPAVFTAQDTTIVTNSDKRVIAHVGDIEKLVRPSDEIVVKLDIVSSAMTTRKWQRCHTDESCRKQKQASRGTPPSLFNHNY